MIEMYKGQINSPTAKLLEKISATATIIKVDNIDAFPEGPNLATIGTDKNAETIKYAVKTSEALSGCVRGVQGAAKTWEKDEKIARNFTQKDHADLIDNLMSLNDNKLNKTDVADNLTSVDTNKALSAKQGKILNDKTGNLSALQTSHKDNLVNAVNDCFTYASNGKSLIANTITGYGVATNAWDPFTTINHNIKVLTNHKDWVISHKDHEINTGKTVVANAITNKGVPTDTTASFDTMASNILILSIMVDTFLTSFLLYSFYAATDNPS